MLSARRATVLLPLLLATGTAPVLVQPLAQALDPGMSSTARACVMHDYGTPRPGSTTLSDDPLWPLEHGLWAEAPSGELYGTSPQGGTANSPHGTLVRFRPADRTFTVLYTFDGKHGSGPRGGLTAGKRAAGTFDGYFYGTTYGGGQFGVGTIFRYKLGDAKPDTIHNFRNGSTVGWTPPDCPTRPHCPYSPQQRLDAAGSYPTIAPVMAADGNLYGVTGYSNNQGYGVLYRIGPAGGYQAICIFDPRLLGEKAMAPHVCDPGITGHGSLIVGDAGNTLYGTTFGGYGSVWRAGLNGGVTVLHRFGLIGGALPQGTKPTRIIQGRDGWLYGTTLAGGSVGAGVLFRLHNAGPPFSVLTDFPIQPNRVSPVINPIAGLIEKIERLPDTPWRVDTMLYGAGRYGGTSGRGSIYRIRTDGSGFRIVHSLPGRWSETGRSPLSSLVLHSDSSIYGTAYQGGMYDKGTMYRVTGTTLPDLKELTVAPRLALPAVAKDVKGNPVKDDLVEVRTEVWAYQTATAGVPNYIGRRGIRFDVTKKCRTPHLVQFLYREEIMNTNPPVWRTGRRSQGYDLTTNSQQPVWDTDTGRAPPPNAYFDQVPGNPVIAEARYPLHPFALTAWDQPSMFPTDPSSLGVENDTRRATFATFVVCNCEVVRRIDWKRENIGRGDTVYAITALAKATPADVKFVNDLLVAQKFYPVK